MLTLFFFFTLVAGPRRSLNLKLGDTKESMTLNTKPYTQNPKPLTLNPQPYTLNPQP